ncbi:MAG: helix-turn-helix domain-containing protein [bacterium]|nr:helix-turn-helix domain-containing protein [bacterium]
MSKLLPIGSAARKLGVSIETLRRWEKEGKISSHKTPAGHRRYSLQHLKASPIPYQRLIPTHDLATAELSPLVREPLFVDRGLVHSKWITAAITSAAVIAISLTAAGIKTGFLADKLGHKPQSPSAQVSNTEGQVLADSTATDLYQLTITVPVDIKDSLTINGEAVLANPLANLAAGSGIGLSQTNTITNTGILSIGGNTGELTLATGLGISDANVLSLSSIPNSALTNSKVTITTSGNLSGGGDVSLGSSISLTLSNNISLSGTATIAGTLGVGNNLTVAGNLNGLVVNSGVITTGVWNATVIDPTYGGTGLAVVGSNGQVLGVSGGNPIWVDPTSLSNTYWQRILGTLSPLNITDDLLIGGTATSSALFQILGTSGNFTSAGSASIAGALTLYSTPTIQSASNQTLTLGGNSTGNILLNDRTGIGISTPSAMLEVQPDAVGTTGLQLRMSIGQTADLFKWVDSSGNVLGRIDSSGNLILANQTTSGININQTIGGIDYNVFNASSSGTVSITQRSADLGTGNDGNCVVSSSITIDTGTCVGRANADAVNFRVTADVATASATITVASTPTGLAVGDEILIINLRDPNNAGANYYTAGDWTNAPLGKYETRYITAINTNTLTLSSPTTYAYPAATHNYDVVVQRVPQYGAVTVNNSGTLTTSAFSTSTHKGGVIFFRATGNVSVATGGTITAAGKGYTGGNGGSSDPNRAGFGGVTYNGSGNTNSINSGGGGGGGAGVSSETGSVGGAGGGGGFGGVGIGGGASGSNGSGSTGGNGGAGYMKGGGGGGAYGLANLSSLYLGSGGGGGSNSGGTSGGVGGGIIFIASGGTIVNGSVSSNGQSSTNS